MSKKKRRKRKLKPIRGLTWKQKLDIEQCLESAARYFWEFSQSGSEIFESEDKKTLAGMHKVLSLFRIKTARDEGKRMKYLSINRNDFVEARYKRFLEKKKFIADLRLGEIIYMTDLDKDYGNGKPMKDIVICDRCNEDILDPEFVMLEEQKVYHFECVKHDPLFKM